MIALAAKVWGWLLSHPATIFMALTTAAFAVVVIGKNNDIAFYKKEAEKAVAAKDALNVRFGVCQANSAVLSASVASQTKAVEDMAAAAKLRDGQFKAVLGQINTNRALATKGITALLARPAPADRCKGAFDLVQELAQ